MFGFSRLKKSQAYMGRLSLAAKNRDFSWEPTLDEVLNDPIVKKMMARDHIRSGQMKVMVERYRERGSLRG